MRTLEQVILLCAQNSVVKLSVYEAISPPIRKLIDSGYLRYVRAEPDFTNHKLIIDLGITEEGIQHLAEMFHADLHVNAISTKAKMKRQSGPIGDMENWSNDHD